MAEPTPRKASSPWHLAGWLCTILTLVQMFFFCVIMLHSSLVLASLNDWALILGFSITGVTAAVCTSRTVPRTVGDNARANGSR